MEHWNGYGYARAIRCAQTTILAPRTRTELCLVLPATVACSCRRQAAKLAICIWIAGSWWTRSVSQGPDSSIRCLVPAFGGCDEGVNLRRAHLMANCDSLSLPPI